MDIIPIPIHLIDEDKDQPRYQFQEQALQELKESIAELGLLSPIKVRKTDDGRYKIIYGNRRYKACTMLGLATVPCIVSIVTDEMEIYLEQIAENLTREGFSPIEEAEAFNKLLTDARFSSSTKYMSSKLGKPEAYIKNKLDLLKFSPAVRRLIVGGTDIRKDQLTEDQLLPLKDLPMEYRDSLALTMAADEMPITDVKRIAKLFKDKEISDATKGKLLFKTGPQLLETWATHEHNKKERAKSAEPAPAANNAETPVAAIAEAPAPPEAGGDDGDKPPVTRPAAQRRTPPRIEAPIALDEKADEPFEPVNPVEEMLNVMLGTLPAPISLSPADIPNLEGVERQQFVRDVDALVDDLERHLAEWRAIKDRLAVRT
ncbi:ParB/RepB/Spo0J family partition protein [Cohnella suwonensis]|uniref:ParB/RepB/Spo0J family partition protein n=1 Tax=Cohnella suwonensis TaxID=696072 RepID=A0ABW0LWP4_9BACL